MLRHANKHLFRAGAMRLAAIITVVVFAVTATGCFNTYHFDREEFSKLQRSTKPVVVVKSKGGSQVAVDANTALYVRSNGGRRYPVSAFNFKLSESQLVASDRDTLLMVNELKSYEADHLSTWQTVLLIAGGAAAVAGIIVGVVVSAGDKATFSDN